MNPASGWKLAGAAFVALVTAPFAGTAQQSPEVPVMVGDNDVVDLPACGLGMVSGLNPQGDNFLAVRSGPGTSYAQIDSLNEGDVIFLCDANGRWVSIVYQPGYTLESAPSNCGATSPISPRQAYSGPCRSGWVYDGYVTFLAG